MAYTLSSNKGTIRFIPFKTGIVEKESESYSSSVTSNPIERGGEINDHVNNAAGTLDISGTIIGGESAVNTLKAMRDSRAIMTYTGVTRMSNLVFTSLKFDRSYSNSKGATFSASFKQIQTTAAGYVSMNGNEPMTSQDAGKSSNPQLSKTANTGLTTVSLESVSSSSAERYSASYTQPSSAAPTTRMTEGYNGLAT